MTTDRGRASSWPPLPRQALARSPPDDSRWRAGTAPGSTAARTRSPRRRCRRRARRPDRRARSARSIRSMNGTLRRAARRRGIDRTRQFGVSARAGADQQLHIAARRERRQHLGNHLVQMQRALAPAEHEHGRAVAARDRTPRRLRRGAASRRSGTAAISAPDRVAGPLDAHVGGNRAAVPSNMVATAAAHRAAIRLTMPGNAVRFDQARADGGCVARRARLVRSRTRRCSQRRRLPRTRGRTEREPRNASATARKVATENRACAADTWTGTKRNPASGTSRASWPSSAPTNTIDAPWRSRSAVAVARAGKTCPAVPPPVTTTFIAPARILARVAAAAASRATLAKMPIADERHHQRGPAEGDEGQRYTGDRQQPGDGAHVHDRLQADPADDPGGEQPLERARARASRSGSRRRSARRTP